MSQPVVIECRNCGFDYTHFDHTIVAARPFGEDGIIELVTITSQGTVTRRLMEDRNNSIYRSRRHATWLLGTCEGCDQKTVVTFTQYKGQTFFNVVGENEIEDVFF